MEQRKPIIQLVNIHKKFPGVYALKNIDLSVFAGEVHSLVGENGAGKSTLINIIAGNYLPDYGEYFFDDEKVTFDKPGQAIEKGIAVVYQELNIVDSLSIAENVFYGRLPTNKYGLVKWKQLYIDTQKIMKKIGLNMDPRSKVSTLSIAQKQMVEIMKACALDPKIIVFDEPTSSLAPAEIDNLFRIINNLRDHGKGVIYISHKLNEIFAISNRVTVLRDGCKIACEGISELNSEKLIRFMVGRDLNNVFIKTERRIGEVIFEVEDLSTEKIHNISFKVRKGEIVGFSGLMGSGRTELACALYGLDKRISGAIRLGGKMLPSNAVHKAVARGVGLIPENRKDEGILINFSVMKNITISSLMQYKKGGIISRRMEQKYAQTMVDTLHVRTPSLNQMIINLSGGNQQKVIIGRWLVREGLKVLIVDEPTRGIDVGAKAEIYAFLDKLANEGMSIIVMSSEMQEILCMCDRICVMRAGELVGEFNREEATQEVLLKAAMGV